MSKFASNAASNKIVSLNGLGRDRNPGLRILAECRDQLVDGLCGWLREVATPVADELLLLADSTREKEQQKRYIDLRADIETDWSPLIDTFRRELSAEAERCQNKRNPEEDNRPAPLEVPEFEGLQLLADEDLSAHIVIREFSAQLAESCDAELYTLNRRVAALLGDDELNDSSNPLAPGIICSALSDACATIGPDAETRLLLLRRLERHLHPALPLIYQQINAYLIERNILPDLKRSYRRSSALGSANTFSSSVQASPGAAGIAGGVAGVGIADSSGEGILDALQRLAQARGGQAPAGLSGSGGSVAAGSFAAAPQGVMLDSATINQLLLSSLNTLQHAPAGEAGGQIVNQVRAVRESENAQQVGGLEAVTIDIVAMLFDFIFDDAHIPVAIKALLSRLQIPVLKVAMLNPGFFADRQHPTRRFLGSVSGISIRWGSSVDETDPFYCKLAELVERIQAEFENDVEVFGTALAELEAFVDEREGEENSTALTAANIVIQREQESDGWERAQRTVQYFRSISKLPPLIDNFLGEHWVGVLQAIAVSDDEDGTDWQAATEAMKNLAWSIEAKKSPEDRSTLISLLPGLLAQLNKGLESIHTAPAQRSAFFDELVRYHSAALKGELPAAPAPEVLAASEPDKAEKADTAVEPLAPVELTPSFKPQEEGDLLVMRSVDNGVEVEEIMLVGASPIWRADDRQILREVNELKRGDWVEFRDEEGLTNRERLNWISPQKGILLFSNHRSAKAISIAPEALVRQIRDGNASILHSEPIFEHALSGALESMNAS
ncbi:MAG: DUF1631 domain-containing protein [Propionivibrio sp.]|uniref:DUF1631 domain-containing protein n=1 Tax=Candidatus Propionivibrio dominans TaxID=2954373 RepID=A0A9D7I8J7_9RHOO|nr:DUF1631 domain-containing protein [Candidatus Propionivibrio dominans]